MAVTTDKRQPNRSTTERARAHIAAWQARQAVRQPSASSRQQYLKAMPRLWREWEAIRAAQPGSSQAEQLDELVRQNASSKSRFYLTRAAINYVSPLALERALGTIGDPDQDLDQVAQLFRDAGILVDLLDRFPADPDKRHLTQPSGKTTWAQLAPPPAERGSGESKRKLLKYLPSDWMHQVWDQLPKNFQREITRHSAEDLRCAVAILSVSGCRPAELEKGIRVGVNRRGSLVIGIQGAKVTEYAGQDHRILLVHPGTPWADYLIHRARKAKHRRFVHRVERKWLNDRVRWLGEKCRFPKLVNLKRKNVRLRKQAEGDQSRAPIHLEPDTLSPYVYRHALSATLKADSWSEAQIAMALGHRVTKTQQFYGTKRQGRAGGHGLKGARGSVPVKQTHSSPESRIGDKKQARSGRRR